MLTASFLTVALVLGEFTIAYLLNRNNLQVAINLLGKRDASISIAVVAGLARCSPSRCSSSLSSGVRRRPRPRAGGQLAVLAVTPVSLEEAREHCRRVRRGPGRRAAAPAAPSGSRTCAAAYGAVHALDGLT